MRNEVYHGDCLEIMPTLPDGSIDMILCDLPYGTTACKWDSIIPFESLWGEYKRLIKPNGAIVLFGQEPFSTKLRHSNLKMFKYDWVWDKKLPVGHLVSKYRPLQRTELIHVFSAGACSFTKNSNKMPYFPVMETRDAARKYRVNINKSELVNNHKMDVNYDRKDYTQRFPTNVLEFPNTNRANAIHPTQKPVALFEYLIKTYTNEGDLVLDNCAGSFTTAIAAINTNRDYVCIERDDKYFELGCRRIAQHQQQTMQLEF